jgi:methylmalonyl-CoA mutase C-terminal domain/subunit
MIVDAAVQEDVDVVALSTLSGNHLTVFPDVLELLRRQGLEHVLVLGGGIIPEADTEALRRAGVAAVFGPGTGTTDVVDFIRTALADKGRAPHSQGRREA